MYAPVHIVIYAPVKLYYTKKSIKCNYNIFHLELASNENKNY